MDEKKSNVSELCFCEEEKCNESIFDPDEFDPDEESRCYEFLCMIWKEYT